MVEIISYYENDSPQNTINFSDTLLLLVQKSENVKNQAFAFSKLGKGNFYLGNYVIAFDFWKQSLEIYHEIDYKAGIARQYNNIEAYFYSISDYENSLQNYLQSFELRQQIKDTSGIAYFLNNIGNIYYARNQRDLFLETYNATGEYTITLLTTAGDYCMSAFAMDIELIENGKSTYTGEIIQAHAIQVETLSIKDFENNATISIYPNPVIDVLNVDFGNITEQARVQIFNTNGQLIYSDNIEEVRNTEININDFASGLYIMQVIENEQTNSVKFIK